MKHARTKKLVEGCLLALDNQREEKRLAREAAAEARENRRYVAMRITILREGKPIALPMLPHAAQAELRRITDKRAFSWRRSTLDDYITFVADHMGD